MSTSLTADGTAMTSTKYIKETAANATKRMENFILLTAGQERSSSTSGFVHRASNGALQVIRMALTLLSSPEQGYEEDGFELPQSNEVTPLVEEDLNDGQCMIQEEDEPDDCQDDIIVQSPIKFLEEMYQIQEVLLKWLVQVTIVELEHVGFMPSFDEVECFKWINFFHRRLLEVMNQVYAHKFRGRTPYTVFICHAGEDKSSYAMPLRNYLTTNGVRTFIDKRNIRGGKHPTHEMMWAVATCKVFWCVASPICVRKWNAVRELQVAHARYMKEGRTDGFSHFMDCFESSPYHDRWWVRGAKCWMDRLRDEVRSVHMYDVSNADSIHDCAPYIFPSMYSDCHRPSHDERYVEIMSSGVMEHLVPISVDGTCFRRARLQKRIIWLLIPLFSVLFAIQLTYGTTGGHWGPSTAENSSYGSPVPNSMMPEVPSPLVGRENVMRELRNKHTPESMVSLVGPAGIGKTHLATHYVKDFVEEISTRRAYWLEAATEDEIRDGYFELLDRFGFWNEKKEALSVSLMAEAVWELLGDMPNEYEWVVVYNNVPEVSNTKEGPDVLLPYFFQPLPLRRWGRGRILFTTRSGEYAGRTALGHITKIVVGVLDERAAVEMLLANTESAKSRDEDSVEAAEIVVRRFGCLPIAIDMANRVIIHKGETVQDYLNELIANSSGDSEVVGAVSQAISLTIRYARRIGLGQVLDTASFLNPDRIQLRLLRNRTEEVNHLVKLSLLRRVRNNSFAMHRMYQEVARLGRSPWDAATSLLDEYERPSLEALNNAEMLSVLISLVPHSAALSHNIPTNQTLGKATDVVYNVFTKTGLFFATINEDRRAREFFLACHKIAFHPLNTTRLAHSNHNLGILDYRLGLHNEARLYLKMAASRYQMLIDEENIRSGRSKRRADDDNSVLITLLRESADVFEYLAKVEERRSKTFAQRSAYIKALDARRKVYGGSHDDGDVLRLARTSMRLGKLEYRLGHYNESFSLLEESLDLSLLHASTNPEIDNSQIIVATVFWLSMAAQKLGDHERHSELFTAFMDNANYLTNRTKATNEAELEARTALYREEFENMRLRYGPSAKTEDIVSALLNLANQELSNHKARHKSVDHDEEHLLLAHEYLNEALDAQREIYGRAESDTTVKILIQLADVATMQNKTDEAREYYQEALDIARGIHGDERFPTNVAVVLLLLGKLEIECGRLQAAKAYLEEAKTIREGEFEDNEASLNSHLGQIWNSLGQIAMLRCETELAENYFFRTISLYRPRMYEADSYIRVLTKAEMLQTDLRSSCQFR